MTKAALNCDLELRGLVLHNICFCKSLHTFGVRALWHKLLLAHATTQRHILFDNTIPKSTPILLRIYNTMKERDCVQMWTPHLHCYHRVTKSMSQPKCNSLTWVNVGVTCASAGLHKGTFANDSRHSKTHKHHGSSGATSC
jgi:hypothetical protein